MVLRRMKKEVKVVNKLGLHARPAAEFVRCVRSFKSTVVIRKGDESFSASSILEVLSANLDCGSAMILDVEGPDAQQVLDKLSEMLLRFREQEEES